MQYTVRVDRIGRINVGNTGYRRFLVQEAILSLITRSIMPRMPESRLGSRGSSTIIGDGADNPFSLTITGQNVVTFIGSNAGANPTFDFSHRPSHMPTLLFVIGGGHGGSGGGNQGGGANDTDGGSSDSNPPYINPMSTNHHGSGGSGPGDSSTLTVSSNTATRPNLITVVGVGPSSSTATTTNPMPMPMTSKSSKKTKTKTKKSSKASVPKQIGRTGSCC